MKKENKSHSGFYFIWGVICAVLICLKLTHVLTWSWAIILLPLYVPLAIVVIIIIAAVAILLAQEVNKQL